MQARTRRTAAGGPAAPAPPKQPTYGPYKTVPPKRLYQWFTMPIIMGLVVSLLIFVFVFVGAYGIMFTETSERMPAATDTDIVVPN